MKKIAVVGTGYVGLVTGVALSEIGHHVTCIDIDPNKIALMQAGNSPIYEPGLDELMEKNIAAGRLHFTKEHQEGFAGANVIYIAVGTPQSESGKADLRYVEEAARDIAAHITAEVIVVTKSTVPVGTNELVKKIITEHTDVPIEVVSNPEFLREGNAVHDAFYGDRIVIGAESEKAASTIEEVNKPFGIPIYKTDIRSAEMIKYASNAFLATKISFVNEIANLCEKVGANVEDVAYGMGQDKRIGSMFLNAGIGYGGSCFPKDTHALLNIARSAGTDFPLLQAVIDVNAGQQGKLVTKAKERFGSLKGKRMALLGLAFKPNTDDMREAASIVIAHELVLAGAEVVAYDPIAVENAKKCLPEAVEYADSVEDCLRDADAAFVVTEWEEIKEIPPTTFSTYLKNPLVFDGRNCFDLAAMKEAEIEYHSIGRPIVK